MFFFQIVYNWHVMLDDIDIFIINQHIWLWLKNIKDCKVIPGECAITQHRILVMDYKSSLRRMARPRKRKPQIIWWKMKKQEEKDAYTLAVMHQTLSDVDNLDWQEINQILVETAK